MNALGWGPRGGRRSASPAVAPIRAEAGRGSDATRRPDVHGVTGHLEIELVFGGACGPQTGDHARGCGGSNRSAIGRPRRTRYEAVRPLRLTRICDCVHARHGLLFHATLPAGPVWRTLHSVSPACGPPVTAFTGGSRGWRRSVWEGWGRSKATDRTPATRPLSRRPPQACRASIGPNR